MRARFVVVSLGLALTACRPSCGRERPSASPPRAARAPVEAPAPVRDVPPTLPPPIAAPPDVASPPADAETLADGLRSRTLAAGRPDAPSPRPWDLAVVHFTSWNSAGQMVDSTVRRGAPARLLPGSCLPGLGRALGLMRPGERRRLWLAPTWLGPSAAAPLVMDVELLEVVPQAEPSDRPPTEPSRRARCRDDGVCEETVRAGRGAPVGQAPTVRLHLEAWTAEGTLLDSTKSRGAPLDVTLSGAEPRLAASIRAMRAGEVRILHMPPDSPRRILRLELLVAGPPVERPGSVLERP